MRIVLQRVSAASVTADGVETGRIGRGYVLLLGVGEDDTVEQADLLLSKIAKLRLFPDENKKTNLSITDVRGSVLVISQFTLYADCRKGNRPSFTGAGNPEKAQWLYVYFIDKARHLFEHVAGGVFGAYMQVQLTNDGPFTLVLEQE